MQLLHRRRLRRWRVLWLLAAAAAAAAAAGDQGFAEVIPPQVHLRSPGVPQQQQHPPPFSASAHLPACCSPWLAAGHPHWQWACDEAEPIDDSTAQQIWRVDNRTLALDLEDQPPLLPITVVVPLGPRRRAFFRNFVFNSIACNRPQEVVVITSAGSAPFKRNLGASLASQSHLFFWDDDCVLACSTLAAMYAELVAHPEAGFVYSNYWAIVTHGPGHRNRRNFLHRAPPFNAEYMKRIPYADTLSLVKTAAFPGFDETLTALQDYDLWLRVVANGHPGTLLGGTYIHNQDLYLKWKKVRDKHRIQAEPYPGFHRLTAADTFWVPIQKRSSALIETIARDTETEVHYPQAPRWSGVHYVDVWVAANTPPFSLEKIRFDDLIATAVHAIESSFNDDANHGRLNETRNSQDAIGPGRLVPGAWSRVEKFTLDGQKLEAYVWLRCTHYPRAASDEREAAGFHESIELSMAIAVEYTRDVQAHDIVQRIRPAVLPIMVVLVAWSAHDVEAIALFCLENEIAFAAGEVVILVSDKALQSMIRLEDKVSFVVRVEVIPHSTQSTAQEIGKQAALDRAAYVAFLDPSLRAVESALQMVPFHCIPGRRVFSPCARPDSDSGSDRHYATISSHQENTFSEDALFLAALSLDVTEEIWRAITDEHSSRKEAIALAHKLFVQHDYVVLRTFEPDLISQAH